jgi:FkbM family methyltransferase
MLKKLLYKISTALIRLGIPFEWILKVKIIYDQLFDKSRDYMEAFHNRWGDLWKEYHRENYDSIPEKMQALKKNMPEESQKLADTIFDRNIFLLPWQESNKIFLYNIKAAFTPEELNERKIFRKRLKAARRKYRLAVDLYDESTFGARRGIDYLPGKSINSLEGKDILDIGAFIGDSALIFSELKPRKIYAFEPEYKNYGLLQQTVAINNLNDMIIPVQKGIGDSERRRRLHIDRAASTLLDTGWADETIEIEMTTIDKFVIDNNLDAGLIKMDIEGFELSAIKGAIETIKKFRPILLMAVYHTPQDFFEIKPLLEKSLLNYKYILKKLSPYHPTYETTLIAYPRID